MELIDIQLVHSTKQTTFHGGRSSNSTVLIRLRELITITVTRSQSVTVVDEMIEQRARVGKEHRWRTELGDPTAIHDQHPFAVDNCVDAVGDRQDSPISKLLADDPLEDLIRFLVDARRCLIDAQYLPQIDFMIIQIPDSPALVSV